MAAPISPVRPPAGGGLVPAEWPAQAADAIVDTIDKVKDKTTRPAITAARAVVYGLLAAIVAPVALILVLVLIGRLYANYVAGAFDVVPPRSGRSTPCFSWSSWPGASCCSARPTIRRRSPDPAQPGRRLGQLEESAIPAG